MFAAIRLASCHIASGDLEAATPVAERAIETAWGNGDRAGEGSAREHAGICALAVGDYETAVEHFTRGLDCWRRITTHPRAEAILHRQLGRALFHLGEHHLATEHLVTALTVFTDLDETYHRARTLYVMAAHHLGSDGPGSAADAITLLEQARPLMEAEDHPLSLSELVTMLAEAHARTGNISQARACLDQATALQQRLNLPGTHPARARTSFIAEKAANLAKRDQDGHDRTGQAPAPGNGRLQGGDQDA